MKCKDCKYWEKFLNLDNMGECSNTKVGNSIKSYSGSWGYMHLGLKSDFGCIYFEKKEDEGKYI